MKDAIGIGGFWLFWLAFFTAVLLVMIGFCWGLYAFFRPVRPHGRAGSPTYRRGFLPIIVRIAILSTIFGMGASVLPFRFGENSRFACVGSLGWWLTDKVRDLAGSENLLLIFGLPVVINSTVCFCVLWCLYLLLAVRKKSIAQSPHVQG